MNVPAVLSMPWLGGLASLVGCLWLGLATSPPAPAASERLLVYYQAADTHFVATTLPALRQWAATLPLTLDLREAVQGVPAELTATPAIVYQNARGRSVYAGRYSEWTTVVNFVRTHRLRPQQDLPLCKGPTLVQQLGRATLAAPLKLTPLSGVTPAGWAPEDFAQQAKTALAAGMAGYVWADTVCLSRTDRAFYLDIHPYADSAGQLYLSLELYSSFNCIRPIFSTGSQPLVGPWATANQLFNTAGQRFAAEIERAIQSSTEGDAWTPLPLPVPAPSWEAIGYELPAVDQMAMSATPPPQWNQIPRWVYQGAALPDVPALQFRFAEPLSRYAGELTELTGQLQFNQQGQLQGGRVTANTRSLTMGMDELDQKVKRQYLLTRRFPEASFQFDLGQQALTFTPGQTMRVAIPGQFDMVGHQIELTVQAEFTVYLNQAGRLCLAAYVSFPLHLAEPFGINGPDGPTPARETLLFDLNLLFHPENS